MLLQKVAAVKEWLVPTCVNQVGAFLGTVGYYRRFGRDFSSRAKPLSQLKGKSVQWKWDTEEQEAFEDLWAALLEAPVLCYPEPQREYILDTDASAEGMGTVLSQEVDGKEKVVSYYSKTFRPKKKNYCVTCRVLLAVVKAMKFFRPYLYWRRFRLRTDHASLLWSCGKMELSQQVARWLEVLLEFNYQLEHRPGSKHSNADGLSQLACGQACKQCGRIDCSDGEPTRDEVEDCTGSWVWTEGQLVQTTQSQVPSADGTVQQLKQDQQESDTALGHVYQLIQDGQDPSTDDLTQGGEEFKGWCRRWLQLTLTDDGVLVLRWHDGRPKQATVAANSYRRSLIQTTHDAAHDGMQRTIQRLGLQWYWPGMMACPLVCM